MHNNHHYNNINNITQVSFSFYFHYFLQLNFYIRVTIFFLHTMGTKKRTRGRRWGQGLRCRCISSSRCIFFFSYFFTILIIIYKQIWHLWQLLPYHPTTMMTTNRPRARDADASWALGTFFFSYFFFFHYTNHYLQADTIWHLWQLLLYHPTTMIPLLQYLFNYFTIVSHY